MGRMLTAFDGVRLLATDSEGEIGRQVRAWMKAEPARRILVFDEAGRQVDIDLREPPLEVAPRGRGRPKLGVQPREVTLLPRHWDWLAAQPGGASATLRQLVEAASRAAPSAPRTGIDAAYRFLTAMAGDRPNYEEALRALYGGDRELFGRLMAGWPRDIAAHALHLAYGSPSG